MMKNTKPRYEAPQAEVVAIESQSVLCASGGAKSNSTQSYNLQNQVIVV